MMLSEWHLTPAYINENFTEELILLLFEKRAERFKALKPMTGPKTPSKPTAGYEAMDLGRLQRRMEAARMGGRRSYEEN